MSVLAYQVLQHQILKMLKRVNLEHCKHKIPLAQEIVLNPHENYV